MPELPEVETIVRGLGPILKGRAIRRVHVLQENVVAYPSPEDFRRELTGRRIGRLSRRGKYILLHLSGGLILTIHLRMTGQLVYQPEAGSLPKHTHVALELDSGLLRFTDTRRFGRLWLISEAETDKVSGLSALGVEPLNKEFTEDSFKELLRGRRGRIKSLLLDQHLIAGLGNIYTDEALHRAGIHPARSAADLSARETRALYQAVREILTEGIAHGGTSIRDYVDAAGEEGHFQKKLRVYGRGGKPCARCGRPITRTVCAGRGTYYCPHCQKQDPS